MKLDEMTQENLDKLKGELELEKQFIAYNIDNWSRKISTSLKSNKEIDQKKDEIFTLAKFLCCYDKNIEIIDALSEKPDFIIKLNDKIIGIELTDVILLDKEKEREGILKKAFDQVISELESERNNYNGIYRIEFINRNISLDQITISQIKSEILNLIKTNAKYGDVVTLEKNSHKSISIYHGQAYSVGSVDRKCVEKVINKKEQKVSTYLTDRIEEIWLLLVLGGASVSSDYSFIEHEVTEIPFKTNFNRLVIFDAFKSKFFELKISNF